MFKIITCAYKILLMFKKETYCLVCRKYTKNNKPKIVKNRQNRLMIQPNCANCGSEKSRFIK